MARPDHRILDTFRNQLLSAINRSPLLKVTVGNTGRLLDLARLQTLRPNLGVQILKAVIGNDQPISIDLPWRLVLSTERTGAESTEFEADENRRAQRSATEQKLIEQMLIRIMRYGTLAKRETGIHAICLGYPLLYVALAATEPVQQLLAPVFLWPILIEPDRRHQGRYSVRRCPEAGPPQFNRAMAAWIKNKLQFDIFAPSEDELKDLTWDTLAKQLHNLARGFPNPPPVDASALGAIPKLMTLRPENSPRIFNSAVVGHFRWQNEAILADLDSIKDKSECQSPVTGFISGMPLEQPTQEILVPAEEDRFLVCDTDFSQERVIWKARNKPGLVVHGPPGTGKSQTIVSIIADALAHGRTVLMVCQKQAATRVVLQRLHKVGLADLCMEVHDPESERVSIFKAVREQVQKLPNTVPAATTQARRKQLADRIVRLTRELDRVAAGFHNRDPRIGLSYREIKAREGRCHNEFPTARPLPSLQGMLSGLSAAALDQVCLDVKSSGHVFKDADPIANPWQHHQATLHVTPATENDVTACITRLRQLDANHCDHIVKNGLGRPLPEDFKTFATTAKLLVKRLRDLAEHPTESRSVLTSWWLKVIRREYGTRVQTHVQRCTEAVQLSAQVAETPLDPAWEQTCSRLSEEQIGTLRRQAECVRANQGRWLRFFKRSFRTARRAIQSLRPDGAEKTIWETAIALMAHLKGRELREQLATMNRVLVPGVDPRLPDAKTQTRYPKLAQESLEMAAWLCEQEGRYSLLTPVLDAHLSERLVEELRSLEQSVQRIDVVNLLMNELTGLETYLRREALGPARDAVLAGRSIQPWLDRLAGGFKGVRSLLRWEINRRQREEPYRTILSCLEDYEMRRAGGENLPTPPDNLPDERYGEWWQALVECTAVMTWLAVCHEEHPELIDFSPEQHEQQRQQLRDLLRQKRELEAESIRERWLAEQVGVRGGPWNQLFQLTGSNAKRLRQAVELSLPRGLLKLRPCWLVDPGTAAQIFPLEAGLFDLVIFDEASQCPIEYAVPAIYRGKTLIVSGDAKQLPPTSFFSTRAETTETGEDDDEDASDHVVSADEQQLRQINAEFLMAAEDLLEASIGNLPEDRLLVHYRSDHPRLIEFSNRAFYHGQLEAPPARMNSLNDKPPIQYHHVNGVYVDRTNREEARKVVELLKNMWRTEGKGPTIGVVTFNRPQRDLIEDLLEKECEGDEAFATRYQEELNRKEDRQDVGFFVKNLENVQGDERDTMIFSTTFGPNADRIFYRRFGPVGQDRGERRLNVAVTRAKHQIIIVGSMPIEQISESLGGVGAPGMNLKPRCYLQLYLAYARAVSTGDETQIRRILDRLSQSNVVIQSQGGPESPLEEEVLLQLHKLAYKVDCQVGESGFRIDMAVLHQDPTRGYLLGIECDGATYHSDRDAHLRDVWRETILRSRGWRLHRIWSTRWWHHRHEEIERLLDALSAARLHSDPAGESTVGTTPIQLPMQHAQGGCQRASQGTLYPVEEERTPPPSQQSPADSSPTPNKSVADGVAGSEPEASVKHPARSTKKDRFVCMLDRALHPGVADIRPSGSRATRLELWRSALGSCDDVPEALYAALAACDLSIAKGRDGPKVLAAIRSWYAEEKRSVADGVD